MTVGLVVVAICLALAVVGGSLASDAPDGLERVAQDQGLVSPAAGRSGGEDGWRNGVAEGLGTVATGAIGVLLTLGLASAGAVLARRSGHRAAPRSDVS